MQVTIKVHYYEYKYNLDIRINDYYLDRVDTVTYGGIWWELLMLVTGYAD